MTDTLDAWAKRAARVANPAGRKVKQRWAQKFAAAADLLERHNEWRRGGDGESTDPTELGKALELAVKTLRQHAGRKPK